MSTALGTTRASGMRAPIWSGRRCEPRRRAPRPAGPSPRPRHRRRGRRRGWHRRPSLLRRQLNPGRTPGRTADRIAAGGFVAAPSFRRAAEASWLLGRRPRRAGSPAARQGGFEAGHRPTVGGPAGPRQAVRPLAGAGRSGDRRPRAPGSATGRRADRPDRHHGVGDPAARTATPTTGADRRRRRPAGGSPAARAGTGRSQLEARPQVGPRPRTAGYLRVARQARPGPAELGSRKAARPIRARSRAEDLSKWPLGTL